MRNEIDCFAGRSADRTLRRWPEPLRSGADPTFIARFAGRAAHAALDAPGPRDPAMGPLRGASELIREGGCAVLVRTGDERLSALIIR